MIDREVWATETVGFCVQVRTHGALVHEERCETAEQALLIIEAWEDLAGTTFEVTDELAGTVQTVETEVSFEADMLPTDDEVGRE